MPVSSDAHRFGHVCVCLCLCVSWRNYRYLDRAGPCSPRVPYTLALGKGPGDLGPRSLEQL